MSPFTPEATKDDLRFPSPGSKGTPLLGLPSCDDLQGIQKSAKPWSRGLAGMRSGKGTPPKGTVRRRERSKIKEVGRLGDLSESGQVTYAKENEGGHRLDIE
jgi:hypothetical protein